MESIRLAFDALPGPTGIISCGRWSYMNPALIALLGRSCVGAAAIDVVAAAERDAVARYYEGTSGMHVTRWSRADGSCLLVEVSSGPFVLDDQPCLVLAVTDRTEELARERERREAEVALRESEARYRLLFDGSPLPIFLFDAETFRFVAVNDKMLELYGYSRDELLAMTAKDIKPPEDVPRMVAHVSSAPPGNQTHIGIVRHRRKDGAFIELDVTSHHMMVGGRKYSLAIGIDVTERRRIEDQLRQSQKMEAIGQLAGGVAHDFNNLLAVILSATSMMRDELGDAHRVSGDLAEIESAAHRAATLTRQLLAFSRKQPHTPRVLSVRTVVEDVEKMLRRIVGEHIELATSLRSSGQVVADAGQLEQVIMNLAVNARDAMPAGGRLTIETANVVLDGSEATCLGVSPGPHVMLSVADTGYGMDDATMRHIFEPFFTTKELGRGTGLGLATVFGIVKQSRGGIRVHSEPGKGSTFRIYLPRIDKEPVAREPAAAARATRAGSESILVVEDDPQLSLVLHRLLRGLGYRTIEARDADSAVAAIASTGSVDLLLTDLVMPGIDGRALATQLLRDHPALKVLFMSGYSEHAAIKTAALGPHDHFIEKPFGAADLSAAIRRVLQV